jgi:hypothetical protein
MSGLLLGIILVASLAFLAFLVTVVVMAISNRKPGQSFIEAGHTTLVSGWTGLKSRFIGEDPRTPKPTLPERKEYDDMQTRYPYDHYWKIDPTKRSGYYSVPNALAQNAMLSSYNKQAPPTLFSSSGMTPTYQSDLNVPAAEAYDSLAKEALAEDLDAMSGSHRFGNKQLPAPPITDDMFRYTGDFEIKRGDPLLSSPMTKTDIGISNRGAGLWNASYGHPV